MTRKQKLLQLDPAERRLGPSNQPQLFRAISGQLITVVHRIEAAGGTVVAVSSAGQPSEWIVTARLPVGCGLENFAEDSL